MKTKLVSFRDKFIFLALVYIVNHIYILALWDAVFWDDWILFDTDHAILIGRFEQAGTPFGWVGYFHALLLALGPWAYRVLVFITYFCAGLLVVKILERRGGIWGAYSIVIGTMFMIVPLNAARVAGINAPYATCYLVFFLAWYLIESHKFLASILFLFSFNTNSLLVFYVLPVCDLIFPNKQVRYVDIWELIKKNWILLGLPLLYFFIKVYFFSPYGFYKNYNNEFSFYNIKHALSLQISEIDRLFSPSAELLLVVGFTAGLSIVIWPILNRMQLSKFLPCDVFNRRKLLIMALMGVAALILAGFPYWLVGHPQRFYNWDSRHQILMPLGVAIILASLFGLLPKNIRKVYFCFLLALFLVLNVQSYYAYYIDWNKQKAIIDIISHQPLIKEGRLIVFEDHTEIPNARGRTNSIYEWNGMLKYIYKDEKRYGINQRDWTSKICGSNHISFSPYYKAGEINNAHTNKVVLVKIFRDKPIGLSLIDKIIDEVYPSLRIVIEDDKDYCRR